MTKVITYQLTTKLPPYQALFLTKQGYFTCQAYHSLPERITVTGCMAHARRRFDEALTVLKKDFTKEQLKKTIAYEAFFRIEMLHITVRRSRQSGVARATCPD